MKFTIFPKINTIYSQILIGFMGGVVDFALLIILSKVMSFEFAFIIGISVAILINYFFTIKYSFKTLSKFKKKEVEIFNYYISYFFTILIQITIMYILNFFSINLIIGKIVAIFCGFTFSILLKFHFIFGKKSEF